MSNIHRGTTPTICFHIFNDIDLNDLTNCVITVCNDSGRNLKEFHDCDIDAEENLIYVHLSHDDSLSFEPGFILVQLTANLDDEEMATDIFRTEIGQTLKYRDVR